MSPKIVTKDDHSMIVILIDHMFHRLPPGVNKVKWLRNTVSSYHNWYGFFTHPNLHKSVSKQHHNYFIKMVSRHKKICEQAYTILQQRKRTSWWSKYIFYRVCGQQQQHKLDFVILSLIEQNRQIMLDILNDDDPTCAVHFYFIIAMWYRKNTESVTPFYIFCDKVLKQFHNE